MYIWENEESIEEHQPHAFKKCMFRFLFGWKHFCTVAYNHEIFSDAAAQSWLSTLTQLNSALFLFYIFLIKVFFQVWIWYILIRSCMHKKKTTKNRICRFHIPYDFINLFLPVWSMQVSFNWQVLWNGQYPPWGNWGIQTKGCYTKSGRQNRRLQTPKPHHVCLGDPGQAPSRESLWQRQCSQRQLH